MNAETRLGTADRNRRRVRLTMAAVAVMVILSLPASPSGGSPDAPRDAVFPRVESGEARTVVRWDAAAIRELPDRGRSLLREFPLDGTRAVDLDLERFSITGPAMRWVLGRTDGVDRSFEFDASRIAMFRGSVVGRPDSHVFLAFADRESVGSIDLGPGRGRFRISSRGAGGRLLAPGRLSVFPASAASSSRADVPTCGVEALGRSDAAPVPLRATSIAAVATGPRQLELAVDTDHEFFELFPDAETAATYLVLLYAQVSDIWLRDLGVRVDLVFARLWDTPDDLFNIVEPSPLGSFRNWWESNMTHVSRDAAQLLSGRRDYPFGGQGWLNSVCGTFAYSVVGYAMGSFPDPEKPSPYHYDIALTAHELGHNAGTGHTHDPINAVDTCDDVISPESRPQRGTIMSYCAQSWSGQNANQDLYFHSRIQQNILDYLATQSCLVTDCNANRIADIEDVAAGRSADMNGNSVPDECEDCNANGIPDPQEIAAGEALDVNANGIPDSCDPDCDADGVPDDREIRLGESLDAYGNGVPDACERDCDADGVSDYTEIQSEMALDVDRDARLDACQDCDHDGTNDLVALAGAHDVWIASGLSGAPVRRYHASSGVLARTSNGGAGAAVRLGQDLIVAPNGNVWVTSATDGRVMEFDGTGAFLGDLVPPGAGGLNEPAGLIVAGERLLVAARGIHAVLAHELDGTPLGFFISPGAGGLSRPFGLTLGPNGNLFVTSATDEVLEYDGVSGQFVRTFVVAADNGGLSRPRGLVFKPDGNLLVASYGGNEILEFDGADGSPLGRWAHVGTSTRLTQVSPWGIRVGPNGNVFVSRTGEAYGSLRNVDDQDAGRRTTPGIFELHLTRAQVYEFDARSGNFVRAYVGGNDHGLLYPTGFDFVPGWDRDCNLNLQPDACDLMSGVSGDDNGNSVPDECEIDCNGNARLDRLDLIPFGESLDCDGNLVPDECQSDCDGDGIPDACAPPPRVPGEVSGLLFPAPGPSGATMLDWDPLSTGESYDVVRGLVSQLRAEGIAVSSCAQSDLPNSTWSDLDSPPPPGDGFFYLVRAGDACVEGSYGTGTDGADRRSENDCS